MESKRQTIVLVTSSDWFEAPRLRHQMAKKLLDWYEVIWIQVPSSSSPVEITHLLPQPNLKIIQLPKRSRLKELLWDNVPVFHRFFNKGLVKVIEKEIKQYRVDTINMVTFQINFVEVLDIVTNGFSIYVCNDPFPAYRRSYHKRLFEKYESRIAKKVDVSLAVSDPLIAQLRQYSPNVKLFLPSHDLKLDGYQGLPNSQTLTLTYMGFIDKRINYDWIDSFFSRNPDFYMRFIGPVKAFEEVSKLEEKHKNIKFFTSLSGESLHQELSQANVLLLPFKNDNLTVQYMSAPNKLFQYLATGRPIVSCEIPALVSLPGKCVYQSVDYVAFEANVFKAISEDGEMLGKQRVKVASDNSWENRGKELKDIIEGLQNESPDNYKN